MTQAGKVAKQILFGSASCGSNAPLFRTRVTSASIRSNQDLVECRLPEDAEGHNSYFEERQAETDQTASERPRRKAAKHSAKTEWLRLAPKYCQKGAAEPG
jgi:hypothetical protein